MRRFRGGRDETTVADTRISLYTLYECFETWNGYHGQAFVQLPYQPTQRSYCRRRSHGTWTTRRSGWLATYSVCMHNFASYVCYADFLSVAVLRALEMVVFSTPDRKNRDPLYTDRTSVIAGHMGSTVAMRHSVPPSWLCA